MSYPTHSQLFYIKHIACQWNKNTLHRFHNAHLVTESFDFFLRHIISLPCMQSLQRFFMPYPILLTLWGRVTHTCVGYLTIIDSDNGLSPGRHQAIIWTNAEILLIRTSGTNFSEFFSEVHTISFSKMHLKTPSAKWRLFGLGLNELSCFLFKTKTAYHTLKPINYMLWVRIIRPMTLVWHW